MDYRLHTVRTYVWINLTHVTYTRKFPYILLSVLTVHSYVFLLGITQGFPCIMKLDRVFLLHLLLQISGLNPLEDNKMSTNCSNNYFMY